MKIIKYTLTPEGTVPSYIIDGGYFPVLNNNVFPQNLDLIGIAIDDAPQIGFVNKTALLTYLNEKNIIFIVPFTEEVIPTQTIVNNIWAKLTN